MPNQRSISSMRRGDVVLVPFPNSDLKTAKLRPALVVQSDAIDSELPQVIIAMISSNLNRSGRRPRVVIRKNNETGRSSGLLCDSVVMTDNLATVIRSQIVRIVGTLLPMTEIDAALRHSLEL